jgi:4-coumarate--CoA ligase
VDPASHVVVLPYSSGTTGLAKGVMLTHRNLVANLVQTEAVMSSTTASSGSRALPFFHIYGMQVLMNGLLAQGCTVVTMARFDFAQALGLIEELRISRFFAVPPMVLGLAKHPLVEAHDLSSCSRSCRALPPSAGSWPRRRPAGSVAPSSRATA